MRVVVVQLYHGGWLLRYVVVVGGEMHLEEEEKQRGTLQSEGT